MEDSIEILMIEDNPGDIDLTREGLQNGGLRHRLRIVPDGVEALRYLRREGGYAGVRRPDLILLDLNLPRKDGRQVLAEIKADPELRRIPVVVLTSSEAEADVSRSYELHANCYVTKPMDLESFLKIVKAIEDFWVNVATLPGE